MAQKQKLDLAWWRKSALRLARAIIQYDNHHWADETISESAILFSRKIVKLSRRGTMQK